VSKKAGIIPEKLAPYLNLLGLVFAWILVFGFFVFKKPELMSIGSFQLLARQTVIVCMASLGMTYIIIIGGIDLSVASIMAFVAVAIAWCIQRHYSPLLAAIIGLIIGTLCGLLNGVLITRLKVLPFIVTLGTYLIVRGAALGLADSQTISPPSSWLNLLLKTATGSLNFLYLPIGVWLMIALAIVVSLILRYTRFGRYVVAVGSNAQAARLCGVPVERTKTIVYAMGGLFAGFGGLMLFSYLGAGDPTAVTGLELDVIAAVVIGGASLAGGRGSIVGSLIGAMIMGTLRIGGVSIGLDLWKQQVITGAIIIASVALDSLRTRGESK
jgi:ribose/xylose/arabinose/galactoside ABC-type transport system permease subunit